MSVRVLHGDCRSVLPMLPGQSIHCVVTSPPYYGLRDYGIEGQIGLEQTPDAYVAELVAVFREARRVLRDDGVAFLNLGDSYAGSSSGFRPGSGRADGIVDERGQRNRNGVGIVPGIKPKDLIGIPWMVAFALRADGWFLRQDIIWHKKNPMPESVTDRCTKAHEYIFLLTKSSRYFYDAAAIAEPAVSDHPSGNGFKRDARRSYQNPDGTARSNEQQWTDVGGTRNRRSVWSIATEPSGLPHFAMMPTAPAELCIKAGCPAGGTVLDPFAGAGTTGLVADRLGRSAVLIELNPSNTEMTRRRIEGDAGMFARVIEAAE